MIQMGMTEVRTRFSDMGSPESIKVEETGAELGKRNFPGMDVQEIAEETGPPLQDAKSKAPQPRPPVES